ncbi:hypothetical protein HYPSUDRAFT_337875 [Hypholoma sublateritium FD-334 SS-4]|uniref:Uncharacterized protein n=1 Tax=Hypholoma sublateritium (strain FD-334 SS-4) TaxID=945553 RepID=A0A0D2LY09_HYPSF|nr:hypothetical protein HYPSUDRAFT_337875 [Hypholoma sublateritium FD-334 SS-4]
MDGGIPLPRTRQRTKGVPDYLSVGPGGRPTPPPSACPGARAAYGQPIGCATPRGASSEPEPPTFLARPIPSFVPGSPPLWDGMRRGHGLVGYALLRAAAAAQRARALVRRTVRAHVVLAHLPCAVHPFFIPGSPVSIPGAQPRGAPVHRAHADSIYSRRAMSIRSARSGSTRRIRHIPALGGHAAGACAAMRG